MKKLYISLLIIMFSFTVVGQRRSIKKADDYFELNYFVEAIKHYEKAESNKKIGDKRAYVTRRLAEANYEVFDYKKSLYWYKKIFSLNVQLSEDDYFNYASLLRINGDFEEAKEKFFQYANLVGDDELKEYYKNLSDWSKNNEKTAQIEVFSTDVSIGGRGLGVAFYLDGLIYSQTKKNFKGTSTPFYDIVYSKTDKDKFEKSKKLPGFYNNEFFNGGAFFSVADSTLYFTSNASDRKKFRSLSPRYHLSKDGINNLRIYSSKFEDGKFRKRKDLSINHDDFSNAHPTLTPKGDTMYFVSNRPSGSGGYDIYRSVKKGESWSPAENLGENVNTDKNEMFPSIVGNKLYFSSYGHMNYGGSDIFEVIVQSDGTTSSPENLGKPYNSSVDDFAMIINPHKEDGYITSNRNDTNGYDNIYYFKKAPPDTINAFAKHRFHLEAIDSVTVNLYQVTGDTETMVSTGLTDTTGTIPLVLEKGKEYQVYFTKEGLKPDTIAKLIHKDERKDVIALFDSAPVFGAEMVMKNIYFAFDKWDILEESKPVLDQLYYYMKQYNEINVFIGAHTDCRGIDVYNNKLSDKRAQSTVEYLIQKGVHPDRLTWKGYGKTKIKVICGRCSRCTEEQHQQNRRVTFEVVKPTQDNTDDLKDTDGNVEDNIE